MVHHTVLPDLAELRQHSMVHQARYYDARRVIVPGLVYQTAMPELGQAQATQYDTLGPKL